MQGCKWRGALVLALSLPFAGCASHSSISCQNGQESAVQDYFYFGTDKPGGTVSPEDWETFLADTYTRGFPDGFTVWQATGQWRAASGEVDREASYVLSLVHPATAAAEASIQEFMVAYKTRFAQEAVLRVTSDACISL